MIKLKTIFASILLLSLCGCGPAVAPKSSTGLRKVSLQLNWFPEAEHGGFYAAQVHGYFAEEGLEVDIKRGGPETQVIQLVGSGERDFGVANADNVVFGKAQQAPVTAVMAPLQTSPRCLLVHADSKIETFADLHNVTIAMSMTQAFSHYLRKKLPLKNVRIVPYSGSIAQFLEDPNYIQQAYVFSEPFLAEKQGAKTRSLMLADLGFNPYTSLLVTRDDLIKNDSELVQKMTRASIKGWQKYLESPAETNAKIHEINPLQDLDSLAFGAQALAPLVLSAAAQEQGIGTMQRTRWQELGEQIVEIGQLKSSEVDVDALFTTKFLPSSGAAR